jgi:FkbM family methyltransferase
MSHKLHRIAASSARLVPNRLKLSLLGQPGNPSRFANWFHSLLNRLPAEKFPVLPCAGALGGYRMRINWEKRRTYVYGTYEVQVVEAIKRVVKPGMIAMDIGANSGYYTLLLSKLVGNSGRVTAYEPLPPNFQFLEENIALNRCSNVRAERAAVAEHSGHLDFGLPEPNSSLWAGPVPEDAGRASIRVSAVAIDDFIESTGSPLHFLKIDVEGAEGSVLAGATSTIRRFHPTMVVELHDYEVHGTNHPVIGQLTGMGYEVRPLDDGMYCAHVLATWTGDSNC